MATTLLLVEAQGKARGGGMMLMSYGCGGCWSSVTLLSSGMSLGNYDPIGEESASNARIPCVG